MSTMVICHSEHHMNTLKIAEAMCEVLGGGPVKPQEVDVNKLKDYQLIGFGSGIYHGRFHQNMDDLIERCPYVENIKCFLYSTTGSERYARRALELVKKKLEQKGFEVVGEFTCPGFDTALSAEGVNKGRPNENDLQKARDFALQLKIK